MQLFDVVNFNYRYSTLAWRANECYSHKTRRHTSAWRPILFFDNWTYVFAKLISVGTVIRCASTNSGRQTSCVIFEMQSAVEADVNPQNYDVPSNVTRVCSFRPHILRLATGILLNKRQEKSPQAGYVGGGRLLLVTLTRTLRELIL